MFVLKKNEKNMIRVLMILYYIINDDRSKRNQTTNTQNMFS